jgi:hypothetical protein
LERRGQSLPIGRSLGHQSGKKKKRKKKKKEVFFVQCC